MDCLNIFLLLASATGFFPTTRSYIPRYPNTSIRIRHFILPVLITLYAHLDMLDFSLRHYESKLPLSEKLQFYLLAATYFAYDASLRAFMFIYGSRLCNLIRNLRLTKVELSEGPRMKQPVKYKVLTVMIIGLHFIHMPIRIAEWWETSSDKNAEEIYIFPKPAVLRLPLFLLGEFIGIISRCLALVLVTYVGLDLIEIHGTILAVLIRRASYEKHCFKKTEKNSSGDILDPMIKCIIPKDEVTGKEMMMEYLKRLERFFKDFNTIVGAYATMIICFAVGIIICEIMALCSPKIIASSMKNTIAGITGSFFGVAVICIITSVGQELQNQVTKGRDKMRRLEINSAATEGQNQMKSTCRCLNWIKLFKWKFTGWGLFEINLSLIPGIAAAVFSFIIFNLQLEISETRGTH